MTRKAKWVTGREEIGRYAVEWDTPFDPKHPAMLLVNELDPEQEQPYRCELVEGGHCTCKAGACKVESGCKHRDALALLDEAGHLERRPVPPPVRASAPAPTPKPKPRPRWMDTAEADWV